MSEWRSPLNAARTRPESGQRTNLAATYRAIPAKQTDGARFLCPSWNLGAVVLRLAKRTGSARF